MGTAEQLITIQHQDRDIEFKVDRERLVRPLLARAGILDIDDLFNILPAGLKDRCGIYPDIDSGELFPLIFELTSEVARTLNAGFYSYRLPDEGHLLYPVVRGGFIHTIAETKLFQRLFGVHQLGLARYYPLPNPHSRGEHSIYLAINMMRSLQALDNKDRNVLLARLQDDFTRAGIYSPDMNDEDLLNTACDLTVLVALMHDLATPAGGDTFKYLLGLREEDELEWLIFGNNEGYQEAREELLGILSKRGLKEKHLRYVIECIQGQSDTLIGQMVSPKDRDELDFDRAAYTLLDCQAATMLNPDEVPSALFPNQLREVDNRLIFERLVSGIHALGTPFAAVLSLAPLGVRPHELYPLVPTNILDFSEEYCLRDGMGLVCERPDKLAWVAAYRVWMTGLHYAGYQMLGLEWELQQHLITLMEQGMGTNILNRDVLLRLTDDELFQALAELNDPTLGTMIARNATITGASQFSGRLVRQEVENVEPNYARFPLEIKAGLDSLVADDGEMITLQQWIERHPGLLSSRALLDGINTMQDKQVVIYQCR